MIPKLVPKSYRVLATCPNCANVFVYSEYDEGAQYYCTLNAPKRPLCGSVAMGEVKWSDNWPKMKRQYDAWEKWAKGRDVAPNGTCDEHSVLAEKGT